MNRQIKWEFSGSPAENYERNLVPIIFAPLATELIKLANLQSDEALLDVACGTGIVARLVAEDADRTGKVVGLDINATRLTIARSLQPDNGVSIEWHESDVADMPFSDATFDVILCQQGLQFFPDRLAALREIHRVLAPKGRFVPTVWRSLQENPAYKALVDVLERYVSAEAAATRRQFFTLGEADEIYALLVEAGYRDVTVDQVVLQVRCLSAEDFLWRQSGVGLAEVMAELDDNTRMAIVSDYSAAMEPYEDDKGLTFPMGTHFAVAYKESKVLPRSHALRGNAYRIG